MGERFYGFGKIIMTKVVSSFSGSELWALSISM